MYKIILVDDEALVLKSLKGSIDWNCYGFEVVGQACNGEEAVKVIRNLNPDLVLTDIRMPSMDGLELIKEVKELGINTEFIVISGYAEFAYAQKAIDYGALGFCVKPFDDDEIIGVLRKAKGILNKNKSSEISTILQSKHFKNSDRLDVILENSGFAKDDSDNYEFVVCVSIGQAKLRFPADMKVLHIQNAVGKFAYLVQKHSNVRLEEQLCSKIPEELRGVGVSGPIFAAGQLEEAIDHAETAAYGFFIRGKKGIYVLQDREIMKETDSLTGRFEEDVAKRDVVAALKSLDSLEALLMAGRFTIDHSLRLYNAVASLVLRINGELGAIGIYRKENLVDKFRNAVEMFAYIKEQICSSLVVKYANSLDEIKNHTFKLILRHINQNFFKDISIQSLSVRYNVNPSYLSQMFKKYLDTTFSDYLTSLRVNYACHLLKTGGLAIKDISERCGYNDYYYFIKVFKKMTGKTPARYRE